MNCRAGGQEKEAREPLVSEEGLQHLWDTPELDYLTHVVFRMYENKRWHSSSHSVSVDPASDLDD